VVVRASSLFQDVCRHARREKTGYVNVQWVCKVNENVGNFAIGRMSHSREVSGMCDTNVATLLLWKHLWMPRKGICSSARGPLVQKDPREMPRIA
jgi:hypothetical protein